MRRLLNGVKFGALGALVGMGTGVAGGFGGVHGSLAFGFFGFVIGCLSAS